MIQVKNMKKKSSQIIMTVIPVITGICTVLFTALYHCHTKDVLLSLAITCGTICYHFAMRLIVGYATLKLIKRRINYQAGWFRQKSFEKTFYKKIRIKSWKSNMPVYYPESFSLKLHTPEEVIQTMCISEVGHEIMIILSFLPLFMAIPFGEFMVFLITSILAGCVDSIFVMIQRYNRPRLMRLLSRRPAPKTHNKRI